jgi:hypothetical protein
MIELFEVMDNFRGIIAIINNGDSDDAKLLQIESKASEYLSEYEVEVRDYEDWADEQSLINENKRLLEGGLVSW